MNKYKFDKLYIILKLNIFTKTKYNQWAIIYPAVYRFFVFLKALKKPAHSQKKKKSLVFHLKALVRIHICIYVNNTYIYSRENFLNV